jgi:hypothetical protein
VRIARIDVTFAEWVLMQPVSGQLPSKGCHLRVSCNRRFVAPGRDPFRSSQIYAKKGHQSKVCSFSGHWSSEASVAATFLVLAPFSLEILTVKETIDGTAREAGRWAGAPGL